MFLARIDNRLVHGQIIESWLPFTGAKTIVVINDELAADELRQQIMSIAIPMGVDIAFVTVAGGQAYLQEKKLAGGDVLVLFATCQDARRAFDTGLDLPRLNVGNLHYAPGKKQLCPHIALSKEDEACLEHLRQRGVRLDYRCVPSDSQELSR